MRDTRLHEFLTHLFESPASIKGCCKGLRMQQNLAAPRIGRLPNRCKQQCAADAFASPCRQDRHAPDLAIRRESCAADSPPLGIAGDEMGADCVQLIPLKRFRHVLFFDENVPTYDAGFSFRTMPGDGFDHACGAISHPGLMGATLVRICRSRRYTSTVENA